MDGQWWSMHSRSTLECEPESLQSRHCAGLYLRLGTKLSFSSSVVYLRRSMSSRSSLVSFCSINRLVFASSCDPECLISNMNVLENAWMLYGARHSQTQGDLYSAGDGARQNSLRLCRTPQKLDARKPLSIHLLTCNRLRQRLTTDTNCAQAFMQNSILRTFNGSPQQLMSTSQASC